MKFSNSKAAAAALLFGLLFVLNGCATKKSASPPVETFEEWLVRQEAKSWELLQHNISPTEPKIPGGPRPRAGIVVAALQKKDPDYYFHWVRDSANVMRVVVERSAAINEGSGHLHKQMHDFLELSQDLQLLHSPYGMGEPRYTVVGKVDQLKWSRPQYDGPALRALAIHRYLQNPFIPGDIKKLAVKVWRRDISFLESVWNRRGFDLWEELYAENYHTRLVQMAALSGAKPGVSSLLLRELDRHWDPEKKYLRSQLVIEKTDGYTKKNTDLDSAVVLAVVESGRIEGAHSVLDPKVQATVTALENLFRKEYPINHIENLGLAYGRYKGDVYFGGNPWPLITAYYAQFYYRLAGAMADGKTFKLTADNREFARALLPELSANPRREDLMTACVNKADRILARLREFTPADGQMYEQLDKKTGAPVSSRGIGWSHSAFIGAVLERKAALKKMPSYHEPLPNF